MSVIHGSMFDYNCIKDSSASDELFSPAAWKPGFLCRNGIIVAVKAKRLAITTALPTYPQQMMNYLVGDVLYAFLDGKEETTSSFSKTKNEEHPVRVALWHEARNTYIDRGWAKAKETIGTRFHVFDLSVAVQTACSELPYPTPNIQSRQTSGSRRVVFGGHVFDSILEARHAVFFNHLNLCYEPHGRTFSTPWGDWTIDFSLDGIGYVEIKPTEPFVEEEQRCVSAVQQTGGIPIYLLYGEMAAPFTCYDTTGANATTYSRFVPGVRGWKYQQHAGVVTREPVVWTDIADVLDLTTVHLPFSDRSWETRKLRSAYESARGYSFEA